MAKKNNRPSFDAVMAFMSEDTQDTVANDESGLIALETILPDPGQPRQLLPEHLAAELRWGRLRPRQILQQWQQQPDWGTNQKARQLRRLADSIQQHGLINPITVRPPTGQDNISNDIQYLIITGERRYWAHVLLALEGKTINDGTQTRPADQIKATIAPQGVSIRAHQFIENFMREDVNAVEKALGLWALRYELSGVNHGSPDVDEAALVPWARVEEALGISKRHRIYLSGVLELTEESRSLIGEANLRERTIRPIVQRLREWPHLQLDAITQLIAWQEEDGEPGGAITQAVEHLVDDLLTRQLRAKESQTVKPHPQHQLLRFKQQVEKSRHYLDQFTNKQLPQLHKAPAEQKQSVLTDLQSLQQDVTKLIAAIQNAE